MNKPPQRPFLTARWADLALVTFRIPAHLVSADLPEGLEVDRLPGDPEGVAYVSLVGFRFLDTKVKGLGIPGHRDFPELNLRVYVRTRDGARRGVLFIAEFVPKAAISMVANLLYPEHYRTVPMRCEVEDTSPTRHRMHMELELGERVHTLEISGALPPRDTSSDSIEDFFKEHEWGFGRDAAGGLVTYQVWHPRWRSFACGLADLRMDLCCAELYGDPWQVLDEMEPFHVMFAEGSEIAVYPRET